MIMINLIHSIEARGGGQMNFCFTGRWGRPITVGAEAVYAINTES